MCEGKKRKRECMDVRKKVCECMKREKYSKCVCIIETERKE